MSLTIRVQILILFVLVAARYSCSGGIGKCRRIPLIDNIDLDKLRGVWYAVQVGDAKIGSRKCLKYTAAVERIPGVTMLVIWEIMKNNRKVLRWNKFSVNNTSHFKAQTIGDGNEDYLGNKWAVSTDYTTYSIWYYCIPGTEDGIIFTLTRKRPPTEKQIGMMQNILRNLGFKLNNVYTINQEDCDN